MEGNGMCTRCGEREPWIEQLGGESYAVHKTCRECYAIIAFENSRCEFDGCDRKIAGNGLCTGHYAQKFTRGQPLTPLRAYGTTGRDAAVALLTGLGYTVKAPREVKK